MLATQAALLLRGCFGASVRQGLATVAADRLFLGHSLPLGYKIIDWATLLLLHLPLRLHLAHAHAHARLEQRQQGVPRQQLAARTAIREALIPKATMTHHCWNCGCGTTT